MTTKFWLIRSFFLFAFLALLANSYSIQVRNGDYYIGQVEARQEIMNSSQISRGLIYFTDKNDNKIPAVLNKEYQTVFASPKEIVDTEKTADLLLQIIEDKSKNDLLGLLSKPNDSYELLIEKADSFQVSQIKSLNLSGIYITGKEFRFYPYGDMASHVLGFISLSEDGSFAGRYGIEKSFNEQLGITGVGSGYENKTKDTRLTIDRNIQSESERIIGNLVKEWNAEGGSIIVQNPNNGEILAMANYPNFNPNEFSKSEMGKYINPSVEFVYEPGSVFKIITMAAGIDSGKITPETKYFDSGSVTLNGRTIRNWDHKSYGTQTITNVIEKSLNTGSIFAERTTGHNIFTSYVEKFGFGKKTSIELPGEVSGNLKNLYNGRDINYATASFGQGVSVTPIQLITAFSTVANGGILFQPSIIKNSEHNIVGRVIEESTSKQIIDMMVSSVKKNYVADIPEYKVAGKTGTAFIPDFKNGGYTDDVINTYIGFVPASNPKFTILIRITKPASAPLAGTSVVPAFKNLAQYLLNYYEIPPDDAISEAND